MATPYQNDLYSGICNRISTPREVLHSIAPLWNVLGTCILRFSTFYFARSRVNVFNFIVWVTGRVISFIRNDSEKKQKKMGGKGYHQQAAKFLLTT